MKKILPPKYFFSCLIVSILLHFLLQIKQIFTIPVNYFGWLLILAGSALNIWTDQLFKKHKITVKPEEKPIKFIDYGPFRFSRNPMYLGMAGFLLGVGLFLGSITSFAGTLFFIMIMEACFIPYEEKTMYETFGNEYKTYKSKVGRWI